MHELIEGLQGIEVIVDDFVAVGCGDTQEEAVHSHGSIPTVRDIRLNAEKV